MTEPGLNKDLIIADLGHRNAGYEKLIKDVIGSLVSLGYASSGFMPATELQRQVRLIAGDMTSRFGLIQMEAAARAAGDRYVESAEVLPFGAPAGDEQVPA